MNNQEFLSKRNAIARTVLLGALTALATCPAFAQEWRLEPEVRLGAEYDDNARLTAPPDPVQQIDGFILEGALGIAYNTQRAGLTFTPRLRSRNYDEVPDVDSNDQFYELEYDYEGLKSDFSIRSSYDIESIRTAERTQADIDEDEPTDIPTDDTGRTFSNDQRNRFRFSPQWSYELTERVSIGAQYTYMDVTYDEAAATFLRDYTDHRVEASIGRLFTERTRGYLEVGARTYENDLGTNDVDGIGAAVGIETEFSETTSLGFEVGYEDTEDNTTGESDSNVVGNFNIVRKLETLTMLANYRRNVAAGGTGRVTARDTLNLNVKKQFTERVAGGIALRAYQTDGLGNQPVTFEERDQREAAAKLEIALSRAFSLEAEYSYTRLDRTNVEGTADSNNVFLWLVYKPTAIIN